MRVINYERRKRGLHRSGRFGKDIPSRQKDERSLGCIERPFHREHIVVKALNEISFTVAEGELVGYIGPNGAGKSTTVKVLSGILVPDGGNVRVLGKVPWKERIETVRQLGVVFGQRTQLWWDLPVIESFDLLRDIYGVELSAHNETRDELIERLHIESLLDTPVRQLSLGQRMRCDLAASLLHAPPILFLDEPTIGLDVVSKLAVRDFVRTLNKERGTTVILTTHDMDDIEALCSRVLVISEGGIYLDGTVDEMRRKVSDERNLIVDLEDLDDEIVVERAKVHRRDGHRLWLRFRPEEISAAELISMVAAKNRIRDLFVENPPIEEVVASLYEEAK